MIKQNILGLGLVGLLSFSSPQNLLAGEINQIYSVLVPQIKKATKHIVKNQNGGIVYERNCGRILEVQKLRYIDNLPFDKIGGEDSIEIIGLNSDFGLYKFIDPNLSGILLDTNYKNRIVPNSIRMLETLANGYCKQPLKNKEKKHQITAIALNK